MDSLRRVDTFMKNQQVQNNWIVSGVAMLLAIIAVVVMAMNKRVPVALAPPEAIPPVAVALPANTVVKTKGLPAGSNANPAGGLGAAPSPGLNAPTPGGLAPSAGGTPPPRAKPGMAASGS